MQRESLELLKPKVSKQFSDDFGAVHASLKYVRDIIDVVKLDKIKFTFNVSDPTTARLISFVSELCKDLNLEMIVRVLKLKKKKI